MTKLLQTAFDEASKLPEGEPEALGRILLEELASERRWEELFAGSHDLLANLADQAAVRDFFERESPEYVFLAAARVGGIRANDAYPAEFAHDNIATGPR